MAISDIIASEPTDLEPAGEGSSQIRQLKADVAETFPNLDRAPLAGTAGTEITPGDVEGLFDDVESLTAEEGIFTKGMIMLWHSSVVSIPAGWALCDGSVANGFTTPDLRDIFVLGAGGAVNPNTTGGALPGSQTTDPAGAVVAGVTGGKALGLGDMPTGLGAALNVRLSGSTTFSSDDHTKIDRVARGNNNDESDNPGIITDSATFLGATHDHTIPAIPDHTHDLGAVSLPPWYALAYICYVGIA